MKYKFELCLNQTHFSEKVIFRTLYKKLIEMKGQKKIVMLHENKYFIKIFNYYCGMTYVLNKNLFNKICVEKKNTFSDQNL